MVKIVHYEVYSDAGDGWKLEERFSNEQRYEAVNLAKEVEQAHKKVKIIKEYFDVQDNSYQESVEYVSGLNAKKNAASSGGVPAGVGGGSSGASVGKDFNHPHNQTIFKAILKLVGIIILCLALANFLVTLLMPVIEAFVAEEITNPVLFVVFFILFLGMAIPLLLKKIPWYVFSQTDGGIPSINERKFYRRADTLSRRYNINDDLDPQVVPVYPEAPLEFKRYIIKFLSDIVANVNSATSLSDSFSRLGVKLVVFGGCFELAKYSGLKFTEANSLLYEAFKILDGDRTDLEEFYEAKKTYKDNRMAVFLTGVGAYLMSQVIAEKPLDINLLKVSFDKWEEQNSQIAAYKQDAENTGIEKDVSFSCQVNLKVSVGFLDTSIPDLEEKKNNIKAAVRNIIQNLLSKYRVLSVDEQGEVTSIVFPKLNKAVRFTVDFLGDANLYSDDIDDENVRFHCSSNIVEKVEMKDINPEDYIADLFDQTYDYEIITTEAINRFRDELDTTKYGFDFLGEKVLSRTHKTESLYKILY